MSPKSECSLSDEPQICKHLAEVYLKTLVSKYVFLSQGSYQNYENAREKAEAQRISLIKEMGRARNR